MPIVSSKTFYRGELLRAPAVFRRTDTQALVDPTDVYLYVKRPGGSPSASISVLHYGPGSPAQIVKESQGRYYAEIDLNIAGVWHLRWVGTGAWQAAQELSFNVEKGVFVNF